MVNPARVLELQAKGMPHRVIARMLRTTPGTVSGIVYRHFHPETIKPRKYERRGSYQCKPEFDVHERSPRQLPDRHYHPIWETTP